MKQAPTVAEHPELMPYVFDHIEAHPATVELRKAVSGLPLARMCASPDESSFLRWLLQLTKAKKAIEVGVFRGVTTLDLALGVGETGTVFALDVTDEYLEEGRKAWEKAGVTSRIQFIKGPGVASMEALLEHHANTVDFVFIDANKSDYQQYYELGLRLLRPGGIIAVDNVLWHGKVIDPTLTDSSDAGAVADTAAIIALNKHIQSDSRVHAVLLPIADGVYFATKKESA